MRAPAMTEREQNKMSATPEGGEDRHESRLQALFTAADPATDPPGSLQQRVAALAAPNGVRAGRPRPPAETRPRLWTPWRIGLGLAGATALALAGVAMAPMWV